MDRYTLIRNCYYDDRGTVVATTDVSLTAGNWFMMEDHYRCPDTGKCIIKFDGEYYNLDLGWERFRDIHRDDEEFIEHNRDIVGLVCLGWCFSPLFLLRLGLGPHGLRVDRTVRAIFTEMLWRYRLPIELVREHFARFELEDAMLMEDWDSSTIGSWELDDDDVDWLVDREVVVIGDTFYEPIDLTGDD